MATSHVYQVSTVEQFGKMLDLFAEAFEDSENYGQAKRPNPKYIQSWLSNKDSIGLVAMDGKGTVVGALAGYVLRKFEQERSEIYIYDLAVSHKSRRKGVATSLIEELKRIAKIIGAYVIFVQADKGLEDLPAQALYRKLGMEEDVFHYDISIEDQ